MLFLCYRCKDVAYIIKLLRKQNLPRKVDVFNSFVREEFPNLIDLKQVVMTDLVFRTSATEFQSLVLNWVITDPPAVNRNSVQLVSRMGLVRLMQTFGLRDQGSHNSANNAQMTLEMYFFIWKIFNNLQYFAKKLWMCASVT